MTTQLLSVRLLLVLLIVPLTGAPQQNFTIQKIEFEGLNRVSPEEAMTTTGLKIGERFALNTLDAAAQKLMDSAQFNKVGYKTRAAGQLITITFQVEEATVTSSRVVFDNFIWFEDATLIGAVKGELPSFTGTAPDDGDTAARIVKALQRFLHEQKIEATVSHITSQDVLGSLSQEHIFTVNGIPMPICSLHFPGSKNVTEARLIEGAKELRGDDYSRKFVSLFTTNNLVSIYREVGQLKATFAPPLARPEATANCKSGVEVTIPVDEGAVYNWNRADWSGNSALSAPELNALLPVKAGQPVNGVKLDQAPSEIANAYGRKGYLLARVSSQAEIDDQAQNVVYKMNVVEGPQFRMGRFIPKGFSESETRELLSRWELKSGDVFDAEYRTEFGRNHVGEVLRDNLSRRQAEGKPTPELKWDSKVDWQALTVDLILQLAN